VNVLVWLAAAVLGGAGALLRFLVDGAVSQRLARDFPYGTFVVNLSGAMLLGFITGIALTGNAAVLAGSAAVGAYTTFSTWMFETHRLGEDGEPAGAFANLMLSLFLGLAAAALGRAIGGHL
jgi:CrcB protein